MGEIFSCQGSTFKVLKRKKRRLGGGGEVVFKRRKVSRKRS